jgi:Domain of unknown function (DUF4406)
VRLYLLGPMSGYAGHNFSAFDAARDHLIAAGHLVVSPADLSRAAGVSQDGTIVPDGMGYETFMRKDLDAIFDVDGVYCLRGWERSRGARLEHDLAVLLGKVIAYEPADDLLPM